MKRMNETAVVALSISLISQIYVNLFMNDFRISFAVILFPVFLYVYKNINAISTGFVTGITVFSFRVLISMLKGAGISYAASVNYQVIFFYSIYAILFEVLDIKGKSDIGSCMISLWLVDFVSNTCELMLRIDSFFNRSTYEIIKILSVVALVRSLSVVAIYFLIRKYRLLLNREEHEERYRSLVLLISSLKSETYLMKTNIDSIEKVMNNSYDLYENMESKPPQELKRRALDIATDVHEIKKDYIRVIKGIEDLIEYKIDYANMSIKDIIEILEDSTKKYIRDKDIKLIFESESTFYTKDHYSLISILRNLINNSIESLENENYLGIISLRHSREGDFHKFVIFDNGKGIKEGDIDYIFNPGFSTKFNRETGDINRGLGLTLVKEIVEKYFGGQIRIFSQYGKGTRFTILIPRERLEELTK